MLLTLAEGITCSDGSALTASDVVANLDYIANPENQSPFLGTYYPVGATAVADDAARTVTITLAAPAPFVLNGLANLPIVCAAGMADRASLASATSGTGPYVLSEAASGDHYTYTIRDGYTWGPNGADHRRRGHAGHGRGAHRREPLHGRQPAAHRGCQRGPGDGSGRPAARAGGPLLHRDRRALRRDVVQPRRGPAHRRPGRAHGAASRLSTCRSCSRCSPPARDRQPRPSRRSRPVACPGDSVSAALPAFDVEAAGRILDEAGWTLADGTRAKDGQALSVTFLHDTGAGPAGLAAAELATQQWTALGVSVVDKAQGGTATQETLFGTGDWDIAWIGLNVSSPDQLVPFLSGPGMAEGGANFAAIANADYTAGVQAAAAMPGTEGCPTWLEAESQLVAGADVVPFANTVVKTFGNGAEFVISGSLMPTSIRMISK